MQQIVVVEVFCDSSDDRWSPILIFLMYYSTCKFKKAHKASILYREFATSMFQCVFGLSSTE